MSEKFRARADCIVDPMGRPRLVQRKYGIARISPVQSVRIGHNEPKDSSVHVEIPVFIIIDRSCGMAREDHIARFNPRDWDAVASRSAAGFSVTLKNALVAYDDASALQCTSNESHIDFDNGMEGVNVGVTREYLSGWVRDADEVLISAEVFHPDKETSLNAPLPSYHQLLDEARCSGSWRDDPVDEPLPELSDYYDDLGELEINTRGDGYD